MRRALRLWSLGLALSALPGAGSLAATDEPLLVIRVSSWDELLAGVRHVVSIVRGPEAAQQVDGVVQMATGGRGLAGVDTSRPLGLGIFVRPDGEFEWLGFLPVKDTRAFEELVRGLSPNAAVGKDGILALQAPGGTAFARLAGGYCYLGRKKEVIARASVPASTGGSRDVVRLDINLRGLDEATRRSLQERAFDNLFNPLGALAGSTSTSYNMGHQLGQQKAAEAFEELFRDAERLSFGVQVKPGSGESLIEVDLVARPATPLFNKLATYGKTPPAFGSLFDRDAAVSFVGAGAFPREYWEQLATVLGEDIAAGQPASESQAFLDAAAGTRHVSSGEWVDRVRRTFFPGDMLDIAVHVDGLAWNQLQLLVGIKVSNGADFDKILEDVAKLHKASDDIGPIELRVGQHRSARLHRISNVGPLAEVFGKDPLQIAVTDSRALFALGPGSLTRSKAAVDRLGQLSNRTPPVQVSIRPSRLFALLAGKEPSLAVARDAARGRGDYLLFETVPLERGVRSRLTVGDAILRAIGASAAERLQSPKRSR